MDSTGVTATGPRGGRVPRLLAYSTANVITR